MPQSLFQIDHAGSDHFTRHRDTVVRTHISHNGIFVLLLNMCDTTSIISFEDVWQEHGSMALNLGHCACHDQHFDGWYWFCV